MDLMRQRDMQQHTYADYLIWSATSGNEIIDGVAYIREPPSPSFGHQNLVVELSRQIANSLHGSSRRVCIAPLDVRLPKNTDDEDGQIDTVVQPDVFIVCDSQKLDEHGVRGAPDWLAEVLSPSTARYDRTTKLSAYERAGVPEVWLVDPTTRTVTIYQMAAGRYAQPIESRTTGPCGSQNEGQCSIAQPHYNGKAVCDARANRRPETGS